MATRHPDTSRENLEPGRSAGDTTPSAGDGHGRTDRVLGHQSYAQGGQEQERGARDYYREAMARAARGERGGYGYEREDATRRGEWGGGEERGWRGRGEEWRGREGSRSEEWHGREGLRPEDRHEARRGVVAPRERGGADMDMEEMARRYRSPERFDRGDERERTRWGSERAGGWDETRRMGGLPSFGEERGRGRWQREPLTASEVMTRNPKTLHPDNTLRDAARIMRDENVGIVPVTDTNGRLLGVLTDRDIVVRADKDDRRPSEVRVADIMSRELEVVTPEESVHDIIELMGRKQVRRVPVVEKNDRLVGIIALGDIATRADRDEELQDALERISSRRSFWSRLFS